MASPRASWEHENKQSLNRSKCLAVPNNDLTITLQGWPTWETSERELNCKEEGDKGLNGLGVPYPTEASRMASICWHGAQHDPVPAAST